jgi:predicted phosphodiesterase
MSLYDKMQDWEDFKKASQESSMKPTLHHKKFDVEKLTLTLLGDTHIGSKYFDEDLLKQILEWCYEKKSPIILMGDMIETATRDSVGAGVYEQQEIVDEQIGHFNYLFNPLAADGLILGLHPGNHEMRVFNSSGLNLAKQMSKQLKVPYFGWGKIHYFLVGKQGYTLYTTHGSSGARLPHTKIKGAIDLANLAEAEVYAMGHLHQLSHHVRNFYDVNKRSKKVEEHQKHFILCGAYLNHWGSYGHVKSYEPMRKGSPKVKLGGLEHSIRVSI